MSESSPFRIRPPLAPLDMTVEVPPSKSLTHRALSLAALAAGRSVIEGPLLADDTVRMARALAALGARLEPGGPGGPLLDRALRAADPPDRESLVGAAPTARLFVTGCGGRFRPPASALDAGGSGTAARFLTALASLADGDVVIDGDARLRQRPLGPLLEALEALGVEAISVRGDGCPPVRVRGGTLRGGETRIESGVSSQFASALLMLGPLAPGMTTIRLVPPVASRPYITLTLDVMRRFGAQVRELADDPPAWRFEGPRGYTAASYRVPPDASSASYFFAAAAVVGGRVKVEALHRGDHQADIAILDHLERMGCRIVEEGSGTAVIGPLRGAGEAGSGPAGRLRPFDLDVGDAPDLVPTLSVLALFARGPCTVRNVANLRLKESDRLGALAEGLRRLGARVEERADGLVIAPGGLRGATIGTFRDHRIAMAFAVAGLAIPGVAIEDPDCVVKSFPSFWTLLSGLAPS